MKVRIFASGSTGNCLEISQNTTHILIDAGISLRRITNFLAQAQLTINEIRGVLITHEHSDHVSALKMLLKYTDIPLYAPATVANRIRNVLPEAEERLRRIPVGEPFDIGELKIRAFHTMHDTPESVGYRVEGDGCFAIATDTGCVTEEIFHGLEGAELALIEANHDIQLLSYGSYPASLKRRILSEHGHLSNRACGELACSLYDHGTHRFILGHLSRENNLPELALQEVEHALGERSAELCCAGELGYAEFEVKTC